MIRCAKIAFVDAKVHGSRRLIAISRADDAMSRLSSGSSPSLCAVAGRKVLVNETRHAKQQKNKKKKKFLMASSPATQYVG